jgi:acetoin utilization deacetylase AcuC-like enzyme
LPARAESIRRALELDGRFVLENRVDHGVNPINAVHNPAMVKYLDGAWENWRNVMTRPLMVPEMVLHPGIRAGMGAVREPAFPAAALGYWCFDALSPIVAGTYAAARSAVDVDVALTAVDLVLEGHRSAYGLCRPPGHHVAHSTLAGYCFF